jgi:hypothetical protein
MKRENRNTWEDVREIDSLIKIKFEITSATWGKCDKCEGE